MNKKEHALEQFPRDIEALVAELGMPQFATKQILSWIYEKGVDNFDAMTNISKRHRDLLSERLFFRRSNKVIEKVASDKTRKLLFAWDDGTKTTETVMIDRKSVV